MHIDKSAAPLRGDLVNDANATLEKYRSMLYPVALATLASAGLAGASQLYKHLDYDRFQPDEPSPDLEASQAKRRAAIERFRKGSGAAWDKKSAADGEYDSLSWPQKLLINKDEYTKAKPGLSKPKYHPEGPDIMGHAMTIGGMLGGGYLAHRAITNFIEQRRLRKSREEAMLSELEMRHFGEQAINRKKSAAAEVVVDKEPNWLQRAISPATNTAWIATLGALGVGGLGGALLTRNAFRDRKREYNANQIKTWMQDQRYKDFQDALTDDYLNETGDDTEKEASFGLLPFAKTAATANDGAGWGGTIAGAGLAHATRIGKVVSGPIGWGLGAADFAADMAGLPSVTGTVSHIGSTAYNTGSNALSNLSRGRGIGGMVTDNLDKAYENSDQMTRHKMTDTISRAGENMGGAGGKIRKGMESVANNPAFQRGLAGGASSSLGAGQKQAGFGDVLGNIGKDISSWGNSAAKSLSTIPGKLGEGAVNMAGNAASSVWGGMKNLYQKADDAIGSITGNSDGTVIAKTVADKIPGQVADRVDKFSRKVNSSEATAEQAGRDMAAGRIDMKSAAEEFDNMKEYAEDVEEGVVNGIKSTVGGRMQNRASGAAVNLAINPNWHKGLAGMAGQAIGGFFNGSNSQPGELNGQTKLAAGNGVMSHAFRRAGETIGKSPEMTDPLAKSLNDAVVPQVAQSVADTYVPQGSFGGLGDYANNAINSIFAGNKSAGVGDYIVGPSWDNLYRGWVGEESMPDEEIRERSRKFGRGSMALGAITGGLGNALKVRKGGMSKRKALLMTALEAGTSGVIGGGLERYLTKPMHSLGSFAAKHLKDEPVVQPKSTVERIRDYIGF